MISGQTCKNINASIGGNTNATAPTPVYNTIDVKDLIILENEIKILVQKIGEGFISIEARGNTLSIEI